MIFIPHQLLSGRSKQETGGRDVSYVWGTGVSAYMTWVGKHRVKRPLGRPRRIRKDNIKMYQETGWGRGLD